jgi:hypothetical protein
MRYFQSLTAHMKLWPSVCPLMQIKTQISDTTWPVILKLSTNLTLFYTLLFWNLLVLLSSTIVIKELCEQKRLKHHRSHTMYNISEMKPTDWKVCMVYASTKYSAFMVKFHFKLKMTSWQLWEQCICLICLWYMKTQQGASE